jgi:sulfoxide reductase heme-binding subunit YedZ
MRHSVSYRVRRIRRHIVLGVAGAGLMAVVYRLVLSEYALVRLSMASAYVGLAFLCASLMLGPWNVLRHHPNPVSTDFRRDVGIWAGILGLVHVVVGLQVHMGGRFWDYFFDPAQPLSRLRMRFDAFGLANYTGLGVTVVLLVLLSLSNDRSLRWLGTRRWKAIHQCNYVGFALVVAHGALYQVLESRGASFVGLFAAMIVLVSAFQIAGFRRLRSRTRSRTKPAADRTAPGAG